MLLKLELIDLSLEISGKDPSQVMLDLLPCMLTGLPLQAGDTQLREVWITSELLTNVKSILSFSQPYYCRVYG